MKRKNILNHNKPILIGMVHLLPTMEYVSWSGISKFVEKALGDLKILQEAGFDAALIENDGDSPCKVLGEASVTVPMTIACMELSRVASIPLGVEVLLNDPKASLSIAKTAGLDFIRTDYYIDRMKRDGYGEFEIDPNGVLNYRTEIEAENVMIFADVQVKYAQMMEKKSIAKSVQQATDKKASVVIITGSKTAERPLIDDLKEARQTVKGNSKVFVGSGFTINNAELLLNHVDGAIVGSSLKTNGNLDIKKCRDLVELVKGN
jgi:hypothetical protein